eukprot:1245392-Amphidinium_carterae.1
MDFAFSNRNNHTLYFIMVLITPSQQTIPFKTKRSLQTQTLEVLWEWGRCLVYGFRVFSFLE